MGTTVNQVVYGPAATGFNGTSIATSTDGSYVSVEGKNQLTILLNYSRSAGTSVTFKICYKLRGDTNVYTMQRVEDGGSGVTNVYDRTYTITGSTSFKKALHIPVNNWGAVALTDVTGSTGDTLTVTMTAAVV